MVAGPDSRFETGLERDRADPRSTAELIEAALDSLRHELADSLENDNDGRHGAALSVLHARGTHEVLVAALGLCDAKNSAERQLGASILGELGQPDRRFPEECCERLLQFLRQEQHPDVFRAAIFALGHLGNRRADPDLARLKDHPDDVVRHCVAFALAGTTHPEGVEALLCLMNDPNEYARDWATTGIGQTLELDNAEIRSALLLRLGDKDSSTRAEAHLGLARRRDARQLPYLIGELQLQSNPPSTGIDIQYDCYFRDAAKIWLGLANDDEFDALHLVACLRQMMSG